MLAEKFTKSEDTITHVTSSHLPEEIAVKKLIYHEKQGIFGYKIMKFNITCNDNDTIYVRLKRCADSNTNESSPTKKTQL